MRLFNNDNGFIAAIACSMRFVCTRVYLFKRYIIVARIILHFTSYRTDIRNRRTLLLFPPRVHGYPYNTYDNIIIKLAKILRVNIHYNIRNTYVRVYTYYTNYIVKAEYYLRFVPRTRCICYYVIYWIFVL